MTYERSRSACDTTTFAAMKSTLFLALFLGLFAYKATAQNKLSDYQYAIVPTQFVFQDEVNQYRLNSNLKFALTQLGFKTFTQGSRYPDFLMLDGCLALTANLVVDESAFSTTMQLQMVDCRGTVVFQTAEHKNREKVLEEAFTRAWEDVRADLSNVVYRYNGYGENKSDNSSSLSTQPDAGTGTPEPRKPTAITSQNSNQTYSIVETRNGKFLMYGEDIVLTLYPTAKADVFLGVGSLGNGVFYKSDGDWNFEYLRDGTAQRIIYSL